MKQIFTSLVTAIGLASLSLITLQTQESAQAIDPCGNPSGVGYQCYEDSVVNGRTGYGHTQQLSGQVQAGAGYVITRSEFINNAQFGSVSGPNIKKVQSGASVQISEVINQTSRELEEAYLKASGEYKKVSAMAEFRNKYQREIAARKEFLSRVESNVDVVNWDASVSGRCIRDTVFGCIDKGGGKLEGKVRVYKLYIGTANDARNFNQSMKTDLAVALSLTAKENADPVPSPNSSSPPTNSPVETPPASSSPGGLDKPTSTSLKCPKIKGIYQRQQDKLVMDIQQNNCTITADIPPSGNSFNHTIQGRWSRETNGFNILMIRTNIVDNCTTRLTGKLYKSKNNIRLRLNGSDTKCELPVGYKEDFEWEELS
jgi:hypothetical protein